MCCILQATLTINHSLSTVNAKGFINTTGYIVDILYTLLYFHTALKITITI